MGGQNSENENKVISFLRFRDKLKNSRCGGTKMFQISHKQFDFWPKNNHVCPKMTNLAKCLHKHDGQGGMSLERRSHDEGGDGEIERQKDQTMVNQNLDLKEYVGTAPSSRQGGPGK